MLILSVLHNIFLTPEQIKILHNGDNVSVISVSLPVWHSADITSEPAEEVFCKYTLTNKKEDTPIVVKKNGYIINLPQISTNEEDNQKLSSANLLPINEGGSEFLHFKEYNKIKKNGKMTTVIHIIEIKTINNLLDSMD